MVFRSASTPIAFHIKFKLDQADGQSLGEPHLVSRSDPINLSLKLIHNSVRISDTPGGGCNLRIG
jgi:hypothetical protein